MTGYTPRRVFCLFRASLVKENPCIIYFISILSDRPLDLVVFIERWPAEAEVDQQGPRGADQRQELVEAVVGPGELEPTRQ